MRQRAETPATLAGVNAARAFFAGCIDPRAGNNTLWVAHLDAEAHCLHLSSYQHDARASPPPTRAILADAVRIGSAGLILAHRRVGEDQPSAEDRAATRRLADAAEACDLTLIDHLIFAGDHCTSMRRIGVL